MNFSSLACFDGDLSYHIEDEKMSYRLRINDVINLQTIIKIYIQLYIIPTAACHSETWYPRVRFPCC